MPETPAALKLGSVMTIFPFGKTVTVAPNVPLPGGPVMSVCAAYILKIGQARNIAHNPHNKIVVTAKRQRATTACESANLRSDLCKGEVIF